MISNRVRYIRLQVIHGFIVDQLGDAIKGRNTKPAADSPRIGRKTARLACLLHLADITARSYQSTSILEDYFITR